jgi:hypothetical protein
MKRLGACTLGLVFAVALWAVPSSAQDKYVMGYGRGT